ncbi:hypothetical protein [Streptomyces sp. NPDC059256]|uniref:hypothetical protein n=1 Tax=Streptomyces sp. NPDC059256 TaxID=3346794 RepID=UPI0036C60976
MTQQPTSKGAGVVSSPPTTRPSIAKPASTTDGSRALKVVARRASASSVRPDPHPTPDGRQPIAWLTIRAPGRGTTPTATSWCACGRNRSAIGHGRVLALITDHTEHQTNCPLRSTDERAAA